jgi:carbon monoxide dehydrogenase subunit G
MKFDNSVEIPLPVDEAWKVLLDVPRIAPCLPGAELTEIEGDNRFKGKVSVKLGPVALAFTGRATIEGIDNAAHRARIKAQGLDSKGRGGANAVVDFELQPSPQGCSVLVHTDLTLNGAVAQYGRGAGLIREVAANLMDQFAEALKAKLMAEGALGAPAQAAPAGGAQPAAASVAPAAPAAAKPISGMSLFFRVLWGMLRRAFK